jgi:hypothetical protein
MLFDELSSDLYTSTNQPAGEDSDSDDLFISESQLRDEYLIYLNEDCESKRVSWLLYLNYKLTLYTNYSLG